MGQVEWLNRATSVEIGVEAPNGADARWCLSEYFRELVALLESGFDPAKENSARDDDFVPPAGFFFVARLDGRPVGCGALKRVDNTTGEIKRVWTASSARRMGIASTILRTLEASARHMGLKTVRLDTNRAMKEAQGLYRKKGYQEIARFNDNPHAHHWFEKRL
jgi:ribosomal protein S18 acetylase RimI-like enzyme